MVLCIDNEYVFSKKEHNLRINTIGCRLSFYKIVLYRPPRSLGMSL